MSRVLMLVCAVADDPVHDACGQRRVDFRQTAAALDAEVLDLGVVSGSRFGRLLLRGLGKYVALAVLAFARLVRGGTTELVLCDNENEALVLATLLKLSGRRVPVVMLGIDATARKKAPFFLLRAQTHIDLWLPYGSLQAQQLTSRRGVPAERVRLLPYYADEVFFDAAAVTHPFQDRPSSRPYVLAVGRQHRDYPLLLEVATDLAADVVIAAGSLYSKTPDRLEGRPLPANVSVVSLDYEQLRRAYAAAAVVVVPTVEADFGPGMTAVVEAMSMARPVVWTRAAGSGDYVADRRAALRGTALVRSTHGLVAAAAGATPDARGPHGLMVPVGDATALRKAIRHLLENPEEAAQLGRRGRLQVEQALTMDAFVARIVAGVQDVLQGHAGGPASSTRTAL